MGKIMSIKHGVTEVVEHRVSRWEWFTLDILAVATVVVCLAFPLLSSGIVNPYLTERFGSIPGPDTFNVMMIFLMMLGLLILLPLGLFYFAFVNKNYKRVGTYLGGANMDNITFEGAMASKQTIELKNYYLQKYFGEDRLFIIGVLVSLTLVFIMFGVAAL
jgi:ech hydrogenase subunit A